MVKKLLILLVIFAVFVVTAANLAALKGPDLLRRAIERALRKTVVIEAIEYHFPSTFELRGFQIREKGRFDGEPSFSADEIRLSVSPLSLSEKVLILDKIWVENAVIIIRQHQGHLTHSLSNATHEPEGRSEPAVESGGKTAPAPSAQLPLEIHQFVIRKSQFKFLDYDVREEGFVVTLNDIDARILNIVLPFSGQRTEYEASAHIVQGRDERPARMEMAGWTVFENMDTDANIQFDGIFLPFFEPYYSQVTSARLESGSLDARANIRSDKKDLVINVDLEIIGLLFRTYEEGDQLFGLKAEEMLSFLKDRAGRLRFQIVARWNAADRSVRARDVIRKSIERSLKKTILGNIGNLIENTIDKIEEQGFEKTKNDLESKIKKIKDLFKY